MGLVEGPGRVRGQERRWKVHLSKACAPERRPSSHPPWREMLRRTQTCSRQAGELDGQKMKLRNKYAREFCLFSPSLEALKEPQAPKPAFHHRSPGSLAAPGVSLSPPPTGQTHSLESGRPRPPPRAPLPSLHVNKSEWLQGPGTEQPHLSNAGPPILLSSKLEFLYIENNSVAIKRVKRQLIKERNSAAHRCDKGLGSRGCG